VGMPVACSFISIKLYLAILCPVRVAEFTYLSLCLSVGGVESTITIAFLVSLPIAAT
jgi:hypothetical protein